MSQPVLHTDLQRARRGATVVDGRDMPVVLLDAQAARWVSLALLALAGAAAGARLGGGGLLVGTLAGLVVGVPTTLFGEPRGARR